MEPGQQTTLVWSPHFDICLGTLLKRVACRTVTQRRGGGSVGKITHWSFRGPWFNSHVLMEAHHQPNSSPRGSDTLYWLPWTAGTHMVPIHTCRKKNTLTHKIKINSSLIKNNSLVVPSGPKFIIWITASEEATFTKRELATKLVNQLYLPQ